MSTVASTRRIGAMPKRSSSSAARCGSSTTKGATGSVSVMGRAPALVPRTHSRSPACSGAATSVAKPPCTRVAPTQGTR